MCRAGGRRCPSSANSARTRALNTANRRVTRARRALRDARGHGDTEEITAAEHRLQDARQHAADVHAEHNTPDHGRDMSAEHPENTDTPNEPTAATEQPALTPLEAADQRLQAAVTALGATGDDDAEIDAATAEVAAARRHRNAVLRGEDPTEQPSAHQGHDTAQQHGGVRNVNQGSVGIQTTGTVVGGTVHMNTTPGGRSNTVVVGGRVVTPGTDPEADRIIAADERAAANARAAAHQARRDAADRAAHHGDGTGRTETDEHGNTVTGLPTASGDTHQGSTRTETDEHGNTTVHVTNVSHGITGIQSGNRNH